MKYVVTGAAGHVGLVLCRRLLSDPATKEVRAVDIAFSRRAQEALSGTDNRLVQLTADVKNAAAMKDAIAGCDAVFHLASHGMSGSAMLNMHKCVSNNVGGIANVLDACEAGKVRALVYTSTYSVAFSGDEINGGDETAPTAPLEDHTDAFAPSKCAAEGLVLHAGRKKRVPACSLRPAVIYGPGEHRYLPRIAALMRLGLFRLVIGSKDTKADWLHVDNYIDAQLLALSSLLKDGLKSRANGETFFISDGNPVNNYEFVRPLAEEIGVGVPSLEISVHRMLGIAGVAEQFYMRLGIPPFMTRAEVYKCGVTHHFSISKAQRVLGYKPLVGDEHRRSMRLAAQGVVAQARATAQLPVVLPEWSWWVSIFLGFFLLYSAVYMPDLVPPVYKAGLIVFKSPRNLQLLWYLACAIHVVEAAIAGAVCQARGRAPAQSAGWVGQTFLMGYPSLRLLLQQEP